MAFGLLSATHPARAQTAPASGTSLKIGIIGTGKIGGALARHWASAGYEVFVSSRHPEELQSLVAEIGPHARAGTPREAAAFGTVILVSVPYSAMPEIGNDLRTELAGKVILDTEPGGPGVLPYLPLTAPNPPTRPAAPTTTTGGPR